MSLRLQHKTASGLTGITDGEPIIALLANDIDDHALTVDFLNNQHGDIGDSRFGTITSASDSSVPTEIQITYDSSLSPSSQSIVIGGAGNSTAIAAVVAAAVDTHGELTATSSGSTVTVIADDPGVLSIPTITVLERGTSDTFTHSVTEINGGVNPTGTEAVYSISRGDIEGRHRHINCKSRC